MRDYNGALPTAKLEGRQAGKQAGFPTWCFTRLLLELWQAFLFLFINLFLTSILPPHPNLFLPSYLNYLLNDFRGQTLC